MPLWAIGFGVSFWVMVICGYLIMRNSGRTEANIRLKNIESKLSTLIDEIRQDRNERKQEQNNHPKQ